MHSNHISSYLNQFLDDFYYKLEYPNEVQGLPSGLTHLDRKTDGFKPGEVVLIGGRPAMGKTFFAMNIMRHIASYFADRYNQDHTHDKCVLYFNLEMPNIDFMRRLIALDSGLSPFIIKTQGLQTVVENKIKETALNLDKMPIYISNNGNTTEEISEEIQRISKEKQVGCVFIDYLQLMGNSQSSEEDYTDILDQIKKLATQLNIPFVVLTQLSKDIEERDCKIPLRSDIRGYNKKQDSVDKILLLHREFYYLQNCKPEQFSDETYAQFSERITAWEKRKSETQNQCDIIIAKNNSICHTVIKVAFFPENGLFKDEECTF